MNTRLAALDTISACLAVNKSSEQIAALATKLDSGVIDWQEVIGIANAHLISPTLWSELSRYQLERKLPNLVHDYLGEIHRLNTVRNRRLTEQTTAVTETFNAAGVEPILLKGAAALFTKLYEDAGSRMLTDIDVLVPRDQAIECWKLLCKQGYSPIADGGDYSGHHHLHPLARPGEYAVIEIHKDMLMPYQSGRLLGRSLTQHESERITELVDGAAQRLAINNVSVRVPSPTHRVLHCLLHAAFSEFNAYRAGTLPLKSILELAILLSSSSTNTDWEEISRLLTPGGKTKLLRDWVYLAHRLFGSALPPGWATTLPMRAHHARCRFQARWGLSITLQHLQRVG